MHLVVVFSYLGELVCVLVVVFSYLDELVRACHFLIFNTAIDSVD